MSERPNNPNDQQPGSQSGWHSPRDANPWQSDETQSRQAAVWREVKALPEDVDKQPGEKGMWHLPEDSDTTFDPDSVVEIISEPRKVPTSSSIPAANPEDLIAEILSGTQRGAAVPNPEDFDYSSRAGEDATAAADILQEGDSQRVDEEPTVAADAAPDIDLDDEGFSFTEYMALASLAQGDDDDLAGIRTDDMSPAEKAAYSAALNVANEMDSKRGIIHEDELPADATITMEDTGELSAADYARQQLQQLQGQGTGDYTAQPSQPQYTQEEIALANQFRETKRQVAILRQQEQQGMIDPNTLQTRLQEFTIMDNQGNWWMIGYETDEWYRYNNQIAQWEAAQPPVPLDAGQARTETGLGATAPDVQTGSLPYFADDPSQQHTEYSGQDTLYDNYNDAQYSEAQRGYSEQYGVNEPVLPYGNQPVNDPNLTQVGMNPDLTHQIYTEPTLENVNIVDQSTIQSDPWGQGTVPSASLGGMVNNQQYAGDGIPQAEPVYQDSGFSDYQAEAAPTIEELERQGNRRLLAILGFSVFGILVFALLLFGGFVFYAMNQYNSIIAEWETELDSLLEGGFDFQTATILAADGTVIANLTGEEGERIPVSIEDGDVSPYFLHAVIASEDPRFYENPGFDVLAIGRAFLQNFFAGEVTSGASTITQQIVRERILGSREVSFDRKLAEVMLSMEVARRYSKNQILEIYINQFFYGEQSYGVEAASQFYFDIPASELNAAQSALLVGLLPGPSSTNPVVAPTTSFSNMRVILTRMVEAGCINFQHEWTPGQTQFCFDENLRADDGTGTQRLLFTASRDAEGNLAFNGLLVFQMAQVETRIYEPRQTNIQYPHFVFYVLGELDEAYGRGAYIERGFTVQTTLIPRIQNTAEVALRQGVNNLALRGVQTGAVIVIDPATGAILSMVGSPDFNNEEIDGQNNNTISYQQPGSAIKPVVYATALRERGGSALTAASILWDVPTTYPQFNNYTPTNFDGRNRGPVPVRYALAQSLNIPAIKAYDRFSEADFLDTAYALGINFDPNPTDDVPAPTLTLATAIGATEVSLMDLTQAYATIANDGVYNDLYVITTITERDISGRDVPVVLQGNLIPDETVVRSQISPQLAYVLQSILSDDVARSSIVNGVPSTFSANSIISGTNFNLPNRDYVAAKTGTNNTANGNPSRIWTVGFTNNYAVGVWMGTLNQATPLNGGVTGFTGASPVWAAVMQEALDGGNPGQFQRPPTGIVDEIICQLTGTAAPEGVNCPNRVSELFITSEPPDLQTEGFAVTLPIHSWTGLRANNWCPENTISETFANFNDAAAIQWLNTSQQGQNILRLLNLGDSLQQPPPGECQQGQALPTVLINFPQPDSTLLGNVAITGQVSATQLSSWDLRISEVGTDNFRSIMPSQSTEQRPTNGSILFEWDSTTVQNGAYTLRLAAFSSVNNGFLNRDVRVLVQNPEPTPLPPSPTPFTVEVPNPLVPPTDTPEAN